MDDGFPRKVTKEEKLAEVIKAAEDKTTEVIAMLSNQAFEADDPKGETVKLKKPKASKETIDNPDGIREPFGKE